MSDSDAEGGVPLIEPEFDTNPDTKKRKREEGPGEKDAAKAEKKRAKRRNQKKLKVKAIDDEQLDEKLSVNHAFEHMDSQLLADYINQRTRHYGKELSTVELEDRFLPAQFIKDTSGWSKPRTLENLAEFLKSNAGKMTPNPSKPTGAPHTIVITASGIRAADTYRALRSNLPKQGVKNPSVAKLFAKHIKIAETIELCSKYKMDFGVGTPERISALLDQGALSTANLKRIVLDASYIDQKKRGILDMKELHDAVIRLLLRDEFRDEDKQIKNSLLLCF
jgi:protein CMS1